MKKLHLNEDAYLLYIEGNSRDFGVAALQSADMETLSPESALEYGRELVRRFNHAERLAEVANQIVLAVEVEKAHIAPDIYEGAKAALAAYQGE